MAEQKETVEKILDAATALFAERGFTETSLRTITSTAGVNLASVNYHFGSKKTLIQEVFSRFLTPFCYELERALDDYEKAHSEPELHGLIEVLFATVFSGKQHMDVHLNQFMRLLGLAYSQSQEHMRHYIIREYGETYSRYTELLRRASPELTPEAFFWRLYFVLGASVFTLSSFDSLNSIMKAEYGEETPLHKLTDLLTDSLTAILATPNQ